jgi:uncharacterized protein (UPF0332 family)
MNFNWELYIQLADELISYEAKADLREAYLRSAMSRCYYGVFCIAKNHLVAKNIDIPRVDTHRFVRERYQRSSSNIEKEIGDSLRRLWKERKDADYEDESGIDLRRAKTALDLSKRTLERLRQIEAV